MNSLPSKLIQRNIPGGRGLIFLFQEKNKSQGQEAAPWKTESPPRGLRHTLYCPLYLLKAQQNPKGKDTTLENQLLKPSQEPQPDLDTQGPACTSHKSFVTLEPIV